MGQSISLHFSSMSSQIAVLWNRRPRILPLTEFPPQNVWVARARIIKIKHNNSNNNDDHIPNEIPFTSEIELSSIVLDESMKGKSIFNRFFTIFSFCFSDYSRFAYTFICTQQIYNFFSVQQVLMTKHEHIERTFYLPINERYSFPKKYIGCTWSMGLLRFWNWKQKLQTFSPKFSTIKWRKALPHISTSNSLENGERII